MCGITGVLKSFPDKISQKDIIKKMLSQLQHRGPDGWGIYLSNNIALGHNRLSIIDIAAGQQPMMSDRYVISYNGEVYNYIELRHELIQKGATFTTNSDTEVILKAYEVYGTNAIQKFNGQFAFLLWDKLEKKLIIARDRYGVRPLYILSHNNNYYFASEVKAFDTIDNYQRKFDMDKLYEHGLLWNTLGEKTIFNDVRSLQPGTFEIYKPEGFHTTHRYYEIGESEQQPPLNFEEAREEFSELLEDSVKLRLRSDVPVANYLSGGIDSSVITLLTKLINKKYFKTFSVSFEDADFDESKYQKEMVASVNSEHFERKISYDSINNNLLDACYHFERPVFRTAPVPLFLLSKDVRENGIKVVLTGEAADEILFGYDSFKELKILNFWNIYPESQLRPLLIKKLYPHLKHYTDSRQYGLMKMYYEGFLGVLSNNLAGLNIRVHNNKILSNIFNSEHKTTFNLDEILQKVSAILPNNFCTWTLLQKNQFLEMKTLLSGYLLSSQGDRMSMAHGVEGRYPFLDHRIIEKIFYYPDSYKLKVLSQKYLLKKSFEKKIPSSIINRPKMPYQAPDLKSFLKDGKFTEQTRYFLSDNIIKNYGIFNLSFVRRVVNKYEEMPYRAAGYRDNMLITFILTTQMIKYWMENPKRHYLHDELKTVELIDY
jgi:asparagine synthase (glutamine-hydrolysing)